MSKRKNILKFLKIPLLVLLLLIPVFLYDGGVREVEAYCSGNKCSKCNGNGYYTTTTSYTGGKMITRFGCGSCGGSGNKIYYYNSSGTLTSTSGSYTAGSGGDHNWSEGNHTNRCTEPTCTSVGCWHYTCTYCGARGATHHWDVPALGHNYVNAGDVVQWTSCTANGYRQYSCSRCGGQDGQWHLYEYAWGHSYGDWYAGSDGYYRRDCTRSCGAYETGDAISYTISFNGNDSDNGEMDNISATYGSNITLSTNVYTRKGYSFSGWSRTPNGSAVYSDRQSVSNLTTTSGATVILYAVWTPNNYVVTLNANGGFLESNTVYSSGSVLATIAGRTYYKANNGKAYVAYMYDSWGTTPILVSTDKDSVAHYDSYDSSTIHAYDSTAGFGGVLEYKGVKYYYLAAIHRMQGDYTDSSGLGRLKLSSTDYESAVKELLSKVSSVGSKDIIVKYSQPYVEGFKGVSVYSSGSILATIAGRTFYKAYDGVAYVAIMYNGGYTTPILVSSNKDAVAHYDTHDSAVIHSFDEGLSLLDFKGNPYSGEVNYNGTTYYYLASVHQMGGNYSDTSGLDRLKLSSEGYKSAALELLDKVYSASYTYDKLPTPEREGFLFKGWYYGDILVESDTIANLVAEDHTLVASWERNKYKVTYHAEGGKFEDGTDEKVVETLFEYEVDLSIAPTKPGRIFLGWSESPDGTVCLTNKSTPPKDIDLYAIYTLPVSDIKEVNLVSWSKLDTSIVNIMPMSMVGEEENGYHYSINNVNTLDGLIYHDLNDISLYILIYDNAGNRTDIPIQLGDAEVPEDEDVPVAKKYLQTTLHYVWDLESGKWLYITTTDELVDEGEVYTPRFLTETEDKYPRGYKPDSIDDKYIVKGEKTTNAYYKPVSYKLYFEPNGGACDTEYKVVYKDYYIGVLPTAEREGYDFLGWYTEVDGGKKISDGDKYSYDSDITVYARWDIHKHNIIFDYATNGGYGVNNEQWEDIEYGKEVILSNQAFKEENWHFVGWNTDPDSKEGMESFVMPDNDVILYAIYSKEVGVTFIDFKNDDRVQREEKGTIYNNEEYLEITIPEQNTKDGWNCMGWAEDDETEVGYSSNTQIQVSDWKTLYGCYEKDVTVSFDTNGSLEKIEDITAKRTFISSGEEIIPSIIVPKGPSLEEHSFVVWVDKDGNEYEPGEELKVPDDITLIATWDKFPEIEAYDRYFSLSFAQSGGITENVLFEKVIATDEEDGTLENGTGVTIVGYQASDFTSFEDDGSVSVTYAATDSFGNRVTVMVVVYIVDTANIEPLYHTYIRFIDQKYYMDADGNYVPTTAGGLESTSRWITDAAYAGTLTSVLANKKDNIEKNIFDFYGKEIEMPNLASGEWSHVKSQWRLSKSAIDEVREYVKTNGYGKFKDKNAIANFYTEFGEHRNY